jgi:enamine deaminase RidA (YjgF/YER057c/UK114 family)
MAAAKIRMFNPEKLAKPSYHWSIGAEVTHPERIVFTAGQGANDGKGNLVGKGDANAQVHQVFKNMGTVLDDCGMSFGNVVKFTAYLVNADDIAAFTVARDEIYKEIYVDGKYPPTTLVIVDRLRPPDLLFELDAIAVD